MVLTAIDIKLTQLWEFCVYEDNFINNTPTTLYIFPGIRLRKSYAKSPPKEASLFAI